MLGVLSAGQQTPAAPDLGVSVLAPGRRHPDQDDIADDPPESLPPFVRPVQQAPPAVAALLLGRFVHAGPPGYAAAETAATRGAMDTAMHRNRVLLDSPRAASIGPVSVPDTQPITSTDG